MLPLRARVDLEDVNEVVLYIPQSSSFTRVSLSDGLVSYPGHLLGESYSSAWMQSVYSTAPTDWASYATRIEESSACYEEISATTSPLTFGRITP